MLLLLAGVVQSIFACTFSYVMVCLALVLLFSCTRHVGISLAPSIRFVVVVFIHWYHSM